MNETCYRPKKILNRNVSIGDHQSNYAVYCQEDWRLTKENEEETFDSTSLIYNYNFKQNPENMPRNLPSIGDAKPRLTMSFCSAKSELIECLCNMSEPVMPRSISVTVVVQSLRLIWKIWEKCQIIVAVLHLGYSWEEVFYGDSICNFVLRSRKGRRQGAGQSFTK